MSSCEWEAFAADFAADNGSCSAPAEQVYKVDQFPAFELCRPHAARALREYAELIEDGIDAAPVQSWPI